MGIGTSLGAYFDDEFHHQAGINTDPSADNNTIDPDLDSGAGVKPKPKLDIMPVSDKPDYDYDSWQKANPGVEMAPGQHYPDTYKLPNHITFSDESIYHTGDNQGGSWGNDALGKDTFTPGPTNLKNYSLDEMKDYFKRQEPNARLITPGSAEDLANQAHDKLKDLPSTKATSDADVGNIFPQTVEEFKQTGKVRYTDEEKEQAEALGVGFMGSGLIGRSYVDALKGGTGLLPKTDMPMKGEPAPYPVEPHEAFNSYRDLHQEGGTGHISYSRSYEERASSQQFSEFLDHVDNYHAANPDVSHGPSPFEQVVRNVRRSGVVDEDPVDRALRQIHEALYSEDRPVASNRPGESFDQLMTRLDREDTASLEVTARDTKFKDYGKIQVAENGKGQFLFKTEDSKVLPLGVSEREGGKTLFVNWIGDISHEAVNSFSKGEVKSLFKALADKYPDAEYVAGLRVSGARTGPAGSGSMVARMRIPGRGKKEPQRKSIEDLSHEWDQGVLDHELLNDHLYGSRSFQNLPEE